MLPFQSLKSGKEEVNQNRDSGLEIFLCLGNGEKLSARDILRASYYWIRETGINVHDDSVGKKKKKKKNWEDCSRMEQKISCKFFFFRLDIKNSFVLLQRKYIRFLISRKIIRSSISRGFEIYIDGRLSAKRVRMCYPRITEDIIQVLGAVCE